MSWKKVSEVLDEVAKVEAVAAVLVPPQYKLYAGAGFEVLAVIAKLAKAKAQEEEK